MAGPCTVRDGMEYEEEGDAFCRAEKARPWP
jgi:hypothetical protein